MVHLLLPKCYNEVLSNEEVAMIGRTKSLRKTWLNTTQFAQLCIISEIVGVVEMERVQSLHRINRHHLSEV